MSFLVDDNDKYPHIQWDTPICELIRDDFVLENEYMTTHITIEDALSHRSGLPGHDESLGGPGTSLKTIVRNLRYMPATAELRTKYQYNNSMFATVSYVIETVTGRRLGDLMREWIWEPLGMQSTFFDLDSAKSTKEHLAHGYQYLYHTDEGGFEVVDWMTLDEVSGAGAVITNVLDYSKWARAIFTKSTPLSNKAFQEWLRPRTIMPEEPPFTGPRMYALGWRTGVYHGQQFYAHSGGVSGFGAELYIFPGIDFAVVSLANTGGTSNFVGNRLTFDLIDERLEVPSDSRFDWNKRSVSSGSTTHTNQALTTS